MGIGADRGIVDEDFAAPVAGFDLGGEVAHRSIIADIDAQCLGLAALLDDAPRGSFRLGRLDIGDDDGRAFVGEALGNAEADALRAAGNDGDAAGQAMLTILAHPIPPRIRPWA